MQIHDVKRNTKQAKQNKLGRGGKRGKTCGKGHKGQNAHSGGAGRAEMRDIIKKIPKLRGRGKNTNKSVRAVYATVSLSDIEANFKDGAKITPRGLYDAGLVRKNRGLMPPIKIVGNGEIKKTVKVSGVSMTDAAKKALNIK